MARKPSNPAIRAVEAGNSKSSKSAASMLAGPHCRTVSQSAACGLVLDACTELDWVSPAACAAENSATMGPDRRSARRRQLLDPERTSRPIAFSALQCRFWADEMLSVIETRTNHRRH